MARTSKPTEYLSASDVQERIRSSNTAKQLGFIIDKAERGKVTIRMPVEEFHKQVYGVVHGGVLAALADTAGGLATYMDCPRGTRVATVEMKINFLEAVEAGTVFAEAEVVRRGRHIAVVDCDVRDDRGRLVAKALMTFFVGPFRKNRKSRS
ncbi:MAG: PaaI family thioesterase [Candidatus Acidiferrales bacterium]|jgi:uncharacterized protein (TIGR00369 family)